MRSLLRAACNLRFDIGVIQREGSRMEAWRYGEECAIKCEDRWDNRWDKVVCGKEVSAPLNRGYYSAR